MPNALTKWPPLDDLGPAVHRDQGDEFHVIDANVALKSGLLVNYPGPPPGNQLSIHAGRGNDSGIRGRSEVVMIT